MSDIHAFSSDVAFTPAVKAIQARKGSRDTYAQVEQRGGWRSDIDEDLAAFLAAQDSMFLATASADGQPISASRRAERLHPDSGQEHAGVRRLRRQPAIHHARQPLGESEGQHLPDRLCPSPVG